MEKIGNQEIKNTFELEIKEFLLKHKINRKQKLIVAVSGGCDSLSLLFGLRNIGFDVLALHINHNLREESKEEEIYLRELFAEENIDAIFCKWHGKIQKNLEQEARIARYNFFNEVANDTGIRKVCLGHHSDDQIETFFLNLSRGSSLDGLSAMQGLSSKDDLLILRPLLNLKKIDCKNYLNALKITWIEDKTNQDIKFKRNKIRKLLFELEYEDLIKNRILDTINTLQDVRIILNKTLNKKYKSVVNEEENSAILSLIKFNRFLKYEKIYILNRVLLKLSNLDKKIRKSQLENLLLVLDKENFKRSIVNIEIIKQNNYLFFRKLD